MWLLPAFSLVATASTRIFYRFSASGESIPASGPVLLVANHPNSLFDPLLVGATAGRPVRFLAKAPLFKDRKVGLFVRGSGAIPVYRRMDDPTAMNRNEEMFSAAFDALASGAAIGLFPEGISHSSPALAPIKTGAARMALGALARQGVRVPIYPIGLVLRDKTQFRSEAHAIVAQPLAWDDLTSSETDEETVRELTRRIDEGLRRITINLEQWEDRPLVECAERIWTAEFGADQDPAHEVGRLEVASRLLREVRIEGNSASDATIVRDIATHHRRLSRLGLAPTDLRADARLRSSLPWALRRFYLFNLVAAVAGFAGYLLYWVPYRVTALAVGAFRADPDRVATTKLLVGIVVYGAWLLVLFLFATGIGGLVAGLASLVLVPLVGYVGMLIRERWRGAWSDVRRFLTMRSRSAFVGGLHAKQRDLALRLKALHEASP